MKDSKKDIMWRVYLVYMVVLLFSFFIIGQVMHIQFIEGDTWKKRSEMQSLDTMKVEAIRGNICANNGSLLATSVPIFDIFWDSQVVADDVFESKSDSLAYCLSNMFKDKSKSEYKKILSSAKADGKEYALIHKSNFDDEKSQVTFDELKAIKKFPIFRLSRKKGGLLVEEKGKRVKPYQLLAKRTIGYVIGDSTVEKNGKVVKIDTNKIIKVGLEGYYSRALEGISGIRLRKKIAGGIWMPLNDYDNEIDPQNGSDVISTIDIDLQDVAENALMKNLIANDADHGCAVLMEVSTGQIKAIANLKRGKNGVYDEEENYAIGEATEPGSTFKLFSLVAGMDDGMVNLDDMVTIGKIKYYDQEMQDSHIDGFGPESVRQAFEESSNVGISQAIFKAYKDNPQRFTDKLYAMRVDQPLGVEIGGEAKPKIYNPKSKYWSRLTLPHMAIGYEVGLTPMQILTFYNAIANNGKMVRPLFVKEIQRLGKTVTRFNPVVLKDSICSPATVAKAKSLLEGVIENGTGRSLKNSVYKIAGKTGTARVAKNNKGYGNEGDINYKASFVGYFPADNPMYSCIVVINSPSKGAYYGAAVAAPVFKEIADRVYATHLEVHQHIDEPASHNAIPFVKAANQNDLYIIYQKLNFSTLSQNPSAEWVFASIDSKNVLLREKTFKYGYVPDVTGMGLKDATYMLENLGLKVNVSGKGKVAAQSIAPGSVIIKGSIIEINLSKPESLDEYALVQIVPVVPDSALVVDPKKNIKKNNKNQPVKNKKNQDKNKKNNNPPSNKAGNKPKADKAQNKDNGKGA
ncbi:MAG: penicillin-binding protein [Bacteroidales bacterium]|jgi:cell division protein FtsI (penicillin-binding protein 3)